MSNLSPHPPLLPLLILLLTAIPSLSQEPVGFMKDGEFYHRPVPLSKPALNQYKKPSPLAVECIKSIEAITKASEDPDNQDGGRQCIGCEPVQFICPAGQQGSPNCQDMIDELYLTCGGAGMEDDGVTLPDGYYFDPQRSITGTWNMELKEQLRIAIGRCACSGAEGRGRVGAVAVLGAIAVTIAAAAGIA
ncbi:hypothetical protein TrCOL_g1018 [Triparma columacea]|uniref:Uncharacterized protein n=1 Tax=Triparma columacea TaxID=722753 RepID=A0A9W7GJQ4_9STRA|nr:hypothetical protein TrCOL_g1018 [Triparma columacea]